MSEESGDRGPGPFRLLRRCDEVEPRLGRLYESWNVATGRPALTLFPRDTVEWQTGGAWRGWIHFDPEAHCVSWEMERRWVSGPATEWLNVITLMQLAGARVEDSPQTNAHFSASPPGRLERWAGHARQVVSSRRGWAIAGLVVLVLGLEVWHWSERESWLQARRPRIATTLADGSESHTPVPPYPLPEQPFTNQALPPCMTRKGEVEIKGGCWIELAKKPPCFDDQAEHEGKCYLPVAKKKPLPQSLKP